MAMLAEPRRKQKVINLRAKNSEWSNDTNKFGQRMLEKMGWSSGKGLGANENGIVEHVVAKYKNDDKGLGFKDKNDQWTKHEDDFNALLANLSNADDKEPQLHSSESLEVKSKKSKARVHYHKYTRGKDLSRYSEKDLANIFGKKTLETEKKDKKEILTEDIKTTAQVFTEKGSMADYFKSKLLAINTKSKMPTLNKENEDDVSDAKCGFKGFSGTTNEEPEADNISLGFGFKPFSFNESNDVYKSVNNDEKIEESSSQINHNKKSKKKKKHNLKETCNKTDIVNNTAQNKEKNVSLDSHSDNCIPYSVIEEVQKKKKKKTIKEKCPEDCSIKADEECSIKTMLKKKKSKKRKLSVQGNEGLEKVVDQVNHVPKRKKNKKDNN